MSEGTAETDVSPRLSVVIPCHNEAFHILSLLDALVGQDVPPFEIIVADGLSDDGTPAIVRQFGQEHPGTTLRLIENPRRSIPAALNLAIRTARADRIVRLDGHSLPKPDYLRLCQQVKEETKADVVGGVWEIVPGAAGLIPDAIALAAGSPMGAGDAQYRLRSTAVAGPVDTVPFGCFDRDTWQAVEGYDESLLSNEDYDFNHRVRQSGGQVYLDPRIRSLYFARATYAALARQYWRYGLWKARMLMRFPRSLRWRQAVPAVWCAAALASILAAMAWNPLLPLTLALWGVYLVSLTAASCLVTGRRNRWRLLPAVAFAYGVIHFCWGFGFWVGLVSSLRSGSAVEVG